MRPNVYRSLKNSLAAVRVSVKLVFFYDIMSLKGWQKRMAGKAKGPKILKKL